MRDLNEMTRRDLLKLCAGMGAGAVLGVRPLRAARTMFSLQADEVVTKPIPSSGEPIPVIGIGTARRYNVGTSEDERAPLRETLRLFVENGGTLIDTAPSYGAAEDVVGDLVAELGIRDRIFLATKVGAGRNGREAGIAELERSFERMKTDRFELMQVHNLAGVDDMLPVLRERKQSGQYKYVGVTTTSTGQYAALEQLMQRESIDFIQIDYAIDNRGVENRILPAALDNGVAVLCALPFGRGRVFEAFGGQPVPDWAQEYGIQTWAQFALKYIVSHPAVTAAIPGTAQPHYATDNIGAARPPMPDEATRRRMVALIDG